MSTLSSRVASRFLASRTSRRVSASMNTTVLVAELEEAFDNVLSLRGEAFGDELFENGIPLTSGSTLQLLEKQGLAVTLIEADGELLGVNVSYEGDNEIAYKAPTAEFDAKQAAQKTAYVIESMAAGV